MTPTEKLLKALRAHAENAKPGETKSRLGLLKLAENAIKYERTSKDGVAVQLHDPRLRFEVEQRGLVYVLTPFTIHETDKVDYMCPNCVTLWKCNGPHLTA